MSLKRSMFIEKYQKFIDDIKPYISNNNDLFPDIETISVSDLIYWLQMYSDFDEQDLKSIAWSQDVVIKQGYFDIVFNLCKEFIVWTQRHFQF